MCISQFLGNVTDWIANKCHWFVFPNCREASSPPCCLKIKLLITDFCSLLSSWYGLQCHSHLRSIFVSFPCNNTTSTLPKHWDPALLACLNKPPLLSQGHMTEDRWLCAYLNLSPVNRPKQFPKIESVVFQTIVFNEQPLAYPVTEVYF